MKTIKEMTDIMLAFDRGEQIQILDNRGIWEDIRQPRWNWTGCDYRVKPKPKYVPFDTAEEFFEAQRKHGRDIIACGELYANSYIDCYCNVFLYKGSEANIFTFNLETLFENCTFADGAPCGKEVEV